MRNEIVLIGPMLAGKSTTAAILAKHFKQPIVSLDKIKWDYFRNYGLTPSHAEDLFINKGVNELITYYSPYEARILEHVLSDHKNCIFDFGAGFSVYEDQSLQYRVNNLLFEYANIFLIMPTSDNNANKRIFKNRLLTRIENDPILVKHYHSLYDLSLYFARHPANEEIAKHVLYTYGLSHKQLLRQVEESMAKKRNIGDELIESMQESVHYMHGKKTKVAIHRQPETIEKILDPKLKTISRRNQAISTARSKKK